MLWVLHPSTRFGPVLHRRNATTKTPNITRGHEQHAAMPTDRRLANKKEKTMDTRFENPTIAMIYRTWRNRQNMVRAEGKLVLQIKAICRGFADGEIKEANKLFSALKKGEGSIELIAATKPLLDAREPLLKSRNNFEKWLSDLAKELPVATFVDKVKGFGHLGLASIVGEVGDFMAYEKELDGIYKRAGLAVIDGERQRKHSNAEMALVHGYSPSRHAVFWTIGDSLLKSQGKEENAGPYRIIYDNRKVYERERVETDGHAHNRALRYMTKRLVKDLYKEWKEVA